jgi:hypothetical protein
MQQASRWAYVLDFVRSQSARSRDQERALTVRWQRPAGHRGKSRIYPDEGVFMGLG